MRLKNYVFFRETDKGVWFDAGRRSFALNGKGIYPLVERLLNALESSGRPPEELATELPQKLQPFAQRLFAELTQHDMLQRTVIARDDDTQSPHSAYAEFLKYLEDNVADASLEEALARWRSTTIAVIGDGYAAKAATGVLADSGCGKLLFRSTCNDEVSLAEFELSLRDRGESAIDLSADAFDLAEIAARADGLIIAGSERFPVEQAIEYARQARKAGITVCISLPVNGHLAVLSMAAADLPGLADLADWLLPPAESVTPSPVNLAIAGSIAAQEMIARFFAISTTADATARIVSPYSEVSVCPIPPSPRRHDEAAMVRAPDISGRIEMPEERELSPYERLRMALAPWADPALPVLSVDLPDALPQLPLYHEALAVRQAGMGRDGAQIVVGWGLSPEEAGLRVSMNAIALLARQEFDGDRALVAGLDEAGWQSASLAHAFIRDERFARDALWGSFSADEVTDPQAKVVLQILRYQVSAPITFKIGFVPTVQAIVVSCHAGEECLSQVCLTTLPEAIRESIGLAISKIQLRSVERVVRPDDIGLVGQQQPVSLFGRDAVERALSPAAGTLAVAARYVRSRRLGLPESVVCGYAVMEQAA